MDKDQIEAAKNRAQQVVDGLARVKDQQARDVIKLVNVVDAKDSKIAELRKIIFELRQVKSDKRSAGINSNPFGDYFGDHFK